MNFYIKLSIKVLVASGLILLIEAFKAIYFSVFVKYEYTEACYEYVYVYLLISFYTTLVIAGIGTFYFLIDNDFSKAVIKSFKYSIMINWIALQTIILDFMLS